MSDEDIPKPLRVEVVCVYVVIDSVNADRVRASKALTTGYGRADMAKAQAECDRINDRTRERLARNPVALEHYRSLELTKSVTSGDNNCHRDETPENKGIELETMFDSPAEPKHR